MYVLPLIKRELSVAVRRPTTVWLRVAAGGGAMSGVFWAMMVWGASASFSGTFLFYVLCAIAMVAVIFAGAARAVDAISLERRDNTLPLLFLTHLDVWDVLLGKVAAAGAVPFLTLLSIFPSLAICQLIGGLAATELWSSFLALIVALLCTLCATLLVSTIARERRTVVLGSAFLLLVVNPWFLLFGAVRFGPGGFALVVAAYVLLGAAFLFIAGSILNRTWRELNTSEDRTICARRPESGKSFVLEDLPVAWMMIRRWQVRTRFRPLALLGCLAAAAWLASRFALGANPVVLLSGLFGCHLAILFGILARTAYAFFNEQHDGSFELFVSTPLVNEDIFAGFARFLHTRYRLLLIALTIYDCILSALLAKGRLPRLASFPITMALVVWLIFGAVRWLGVYRALMMNTPLLSVFATFARLALFPIILSILFLFAPRTDYFKICMFWVGSTAFLATFFGYDARRVLIERGRELLLRPASEKPPHIETEWSFINWDAIQEPAAALKPDTSAANA